jgi:hypothetical protein
MQCLPPAQEACCGPLASRRDFTERRARVEIRRTGADQRKALEALPACNRNAQMREEEPGAHGQMDAVQHVQEAIASGARRRSGRPIAAISLNGTQKAGFQLSCRALPTDSGGKKLQLPE